MKKVFTALAFVLISSAAHSGSITSWRCEYTLLTDTTAVKLTTDANLTSSATMTVDNASPSGSYTVSSNTVTNTYSGELECGTVNFIVTDNSTTYND